MNKLRIFLVLLIILSPWLYADRTLISIGSDHELARDQILKAFPVGTSKENLLHAFPKYFVVFNCALNDEQGFVLPHSDMKSRNIHGEVGSSSIVITLDIVFPYGIGFPAIGMLYAYLGFDDKNNLVDVQVVRSYDGT